jgi:thiol:disulfide interchange protein DsbC
MTHLCRLALCAALLTASAACAEPLPAGQTAAATPQADPAPQGGEHAELRRQLEELVGLPPDEIRPSSAANMLEARWGTNFAYVTPDGRHVVYGDMLDLATGEAISENSRKRMRVAVLDRLGADNMIEFAPRKPKHTVTVFTDIDCGYCRKMHREMQAYNDSGIAVRYVFFPRTGPGTDSFRKAEAVWCSKDRKMALTRAKSGANVSAPSCPNPILREWEVGQELGLRGTPMIVLDDGEVVNGYLPAAALLARIKGAPAPAN